MSEHPTTELDRLLSLLADRGTQGVSPEEAAEIERLRPRFDQLDESALDLAVAGIELALGGTQRDALPTTLRVGLEADAQQFVPAAAEAARKAAELARLAASEAAEEPAGTASETPAGGRAQRALRGRRAFDRRAAWLLGAAGFLIGFLIVVRILCQ
ncbi:MAG: hypothetical protein JSU66_16700 [Deltaproteobacteria bacterium]|nr:MAG: hypothetical protein JSU66_16700 [Deltaproteobacteria bacterium]